MRRILSVVVLYAAVAVSTFIFVTIAAKLLENTEVKPEGVYYDCQTEHNNITRR